MGSRTENVVFTTSFSAMFVVSLVHILHSWTSLWCPISLSAFCANMPLLKKQRHPKWFGFSCHLPTTQTSFFQKKKVLKNYFMSLVNKMYCIHYTVPQNWIFSFKIQKWATLSAWFRSEDLKSMKKDGLDFGHCAVEFFSKQG